MTSEVIDLDTATKVKLWATRYYLYEAQSASGAGSVAIKDMQGNVIGPSLKSKDWCLATIEGSVRVDGRTFNYAGTTGLPQTRCSAKKANARMRWQESEHKYGLGNKSNPLIPFKTIACDQGTVANSKPWLNGGFAKFGQRFFIPAAKGTRLPDGSLHDGIFVCGDVGSAITGNHIDVFIGGAKGWRDAAKKDPFSFIRSNANASFVAYALP
jgi:hypothetical protein